MLKGNTLRRLILKELEGKFFPAHVRREGKPLTPLSITCMFSSPSGKRCVFRATDFLEVERCNLVDTEMGIYSCVHEGVIFHVQASDESEEKYIKDGKIPLCHTHISLIKSKAKGLS